MTTTEQLESSFAPCVLKHAKAKYEAQAKKGKWESFLKDLADPKSAEALPLKVNLNDPISQYFISSSHNTYLTGNQLWSKASTDPYKDVLKRGCRCIEVDVWDGGSPSATSSSSSSDNEDTGSKQPPKRTSNAGDADVNKLAGAIKKGIGRIRSASSAGSTKQAPETEPAAAPQQDDARMPTPWRTNSREEPRVLHGYTATKEISFRAVCEVVRDYAFVASDLPLIVSLEVHCSHEQQEVMVECMNDYWKGYLVDIPKNFSDETPLPPLSSLKKKILVKVKYTPPEKKQSKFGRSAKGASEKDEDEEDQVDPSKKGKIIEGLSKLGVYVRSCHFDSLDQPEAKIPTHIFAISESKVISLLEQNRTALFKHNLNHLMRAYPKGTRVRSTNLDPGPFWRQGIQIVALNWQQMNAAMMMNDAMFTDSGGWINKPIGYKPASKAGEHPPPIRRISIDLNIQLLAAQKLDQEKSSAPNCFVKAEIHVESKTEKEAGSIPEGGKNKGGEWKRKSAVRHSKDPDFGGDTLEFKGVEELIPELSFIRIKVMDDDAFQKDRMIGWACFRLDRFPEGLRLLPLKGGDSKPTGATLLVDSQLTKRG